MDRISAYVDGIRDGAVFGWIANIDHPERLEQVVVRGETGATARFHAFLPRHDVCQAVGATGRFGFAIPVSLLDGLGGQVWLNNVNGALLEQGGPLRLPPVPPTAPDVPAWAVLHIPKTAGTSLRVVLEGAVRFGESVLLYDDGFNGVSLTELTGMSSRQLSGFRMAYGHVMSQGFFVLPRRLEFITVLRRAEARLRSHYYHHLSVGLGLPGPDGLVDVPTALNEGLVDDFDNMMVRMITSQPRQTIPLGGIDESHVLMALHALRTSFRFVATAEDLQAQMPALCRAVGLSERVLPRVNEQRMAATPAHEAAIDWERVLRRNRFDAMLYGRAVEEGLCGRDLMPPGQVRDPAALPP